MSIAHAWSTNILPEAAVSELKSKLDLEQPSLVLFFASPAIDTTSLGLEMQLAFPSARTFGCTTAGEIVSGRMMKHAVVAMAFDASAVADVDIQVVKNPGDARCVKDAFGRFQSHFGQPASDMDFQQYVGIVLADGLGRAEEQLMDTIGNLTNVVFVGGSAGDDLAFESTLVVADGVVYSHAAVLALLKPSVPFEVLKTQSFAQLDRKLVATSVDEASRTVIEFDGIPAVVAYGKAVGAEPAAVADHFMHHPVGLMVGNEPYVRSPQRVQDNSIVFYCNVLEGMELTVLQSGDMIGDTRRAIDESASRLGGITGLINFNCILRTLELEATGKTEDYGKLFSAIPTIGFSTYGEEYVGHINQTAVMLAFGR